MSMGLPMVHAYLVCFARGLPGATMDEHVGCESPGKFQRAGIHRVVCWLDEHSKVHLTDILPSLMALWGYQAIWIFEQRFLPVE